MHARLERLLAVRGDFGREAVRERIALVAALSRARPRGAAEVAALHDELLFAAAFPASSAEARGARRALSRFREIVEALPAAERALLEDSGIAGTTTTNTFIYGIARWLAAHGERIAFTSPRERDAEELDPLLRLVLTPGEEDRFDSGEVTTRAWMAEASGARGDAARWLLAAAPDAHDSDTGRLWRSLYDAADVPMTWDLGDSPRSSTHNHIRVRPRVRAGMRRAPADPVSLIAQPMRGIRRLRSAEAERWHDAAVAALAARAREVFPTVYANRDEVVLAPLGEGATLCLLGVAPRDRSALEANYGYVMFANGIPIGYGGFTALGDQCNTGVNLFAAFRGSEAAFLYAQALRAARQYLGITRFVVNPYQFGADNDEAIASGAFWFYHRLGFRPADPASARLAERERERMRRDRTHRSSPRTLRALARGDLVLELGGRTRGALISERVLLTTGALATRGLVESGAAERLASIMSEALRLRRLCGGRGRSLSPAERLGATLLAPILVPLATRITRWPAAERRALWRLVALKGARQEAGFARAAARLPRLWRLLGR
jgi:hypothetical protein